MNPCEGWRFIESPGEEPRVLTFAQVLAVWQALGLSMDIPSAPIAIQASGGYVVLSNENHLTVMPRAEWRQKLADWRPTYILPGKGE